MKKKIILPIALGLLLVGGVLVGIFWDPIIDWLPIDQSGWKLMKNGGTCYLDEDGDPIPGWLEAEGNIYYFDTESYAMQTHWVELDDGRYYLGDDGIRRTGWQKIDGNRYYLGDNGAMVTGWLEQTGGTMYLNEQGNPHSGWLELDEGTYYLDENYFRYSGWLELDKKRYYLDEEGMLFHGWLDQEEGKYYLGEDGTPMTGWLEYEENLYYLNKSGIMQTGWLELDGRKYYLKVDGSAAKGKQVIDGQTYYFTATGANIILVNRWNFLPADYAPEITEAYPDCWVSVECSDEVLNMLTDLQTATGGTGLLNGYRSYNTQFSGFHTAIQNLVDDGVDYATAYAAVSSSFAIPGTSEHQSGLAVDVMGRYDHFYEQGESETIRWLKEHCWEYGFILRYPEGKSHITGIRYESWHFRYVGTDLALELKDSGLCLEEYLDALTDDGSTCGNPDAQDRGN